MPLIAADAAGLRRAARLGFAVLLAALVAHGCHGVDEDHEPAAPPPIRHEPE